MLQFIGSYFAKRHARGFLERLEKTDLNGYKLLVVASTDVRIKLKESGVDIKKILEEPQSKQVIGFVTDSLRKLAVQALKSESDLVAMKGVAIEFWIHNLRATYFPLLEPYVKKMWKIYALGLPNNMATAYLWCDTMESTKSMEKAFQIVEEAKFIPERFSI